jgi:hypothetical protein
MRYISFRSMLMLLILLGENINTVKETLKLLDASKEVGLEINTEKTKYMFMSHHQATKQNLYSKVANKSF